MEIDRTTREPLAPLAQRQNVALAPVAAPSVVGADPVLLIGGPDSADATGVDEAAAPLVDLCLSPLAQTPFRVGLVGPYGAGKSFALRRLVRAISVAASQPPDAASPRHSKIVIVDFDAAGLGSDRAIGFDPASALASATFVALENGRDGVSYQALADEAAHGTADPARAALAASERHDDAGRRLEAERQARSEIESKRARLTESLIFETPGGRVDSMIRTSRSTIESRLNRFGFDDGDPAANFRALLRDLAGAGAGSRAGLLVRSTWAYRGQFALLLLAVAAAAAAYGLKRLGAAAGDGSLGDLVSGAQPVADFVNAHASWLDKGVSALLAVAGLAAFFNLWRAAGFTALLYRGLRLLRLDSVERRRELDASAERADRRLSALAAEADVASKRAEALTKRAGGARHVVRPPGPPFLKALETPAKTSRDFFAELGRLMRGPASAETPAPSRIVFAIDNLEALPPVDAARLIDALQTFLGPGAVALVACDPDALAPGAGSGFARTRFDVVFNLAGIVVGDSAARTAKLIGEGARAAGAPTRRATGPLAEPLSPAEGALLSALAPLGDGAPGSIRRLHNAYRLARLSEAPRPLVAVMLAALMSPNRDYARTLANMFGASEEPMDEPTGIPTLVAALQAARGVHGGPFSKADALAAWRAARLWAPSQG